MPTRQWLLQGFSLGTGDSPGQGSGSMSQMNSSQQQNSNRSARFISQHPSHGRTSSTPSGPEHRKPSEIKQCALTHSRGSGSDKNIDVWVTGPLLCQMPPGNVGNPCFRVCLLYGFTRSSASMFSHRCVVDESCSPVREG